MLKTKPTIYPLSRLQAIADRNSFWLALLCSVLFFIVFNLVATPLLNSDDDAFFMYSLAGGYGEAPTQLLHYNYGWHPWLGGIVKSLFSICPGLNWYSVVLFLFHCAGYTAIIYVLLKKLRIELALFFAAILFCFVEARLLLYFTYTAAAIVASVGAISLLISEYQQLLRKNGVILVAALLLLLAGMLRLHIVLLVALLFLPLSITALSRKRWIKCFTTLALVTLSLFIFNKIQEDVYSRKIPNWREQERFRQGLFHAYNRQLRDSVSSAAFTDNAEQSLFMRGFLYDSTRFTAERVKKMAWAVTRDRSLMNSGDRQGLYWFFMELRVYLLLTGFVLLGFYLNRHRLIIRNWLFSLLLTILFQGVLFIYFKITLVLYLGLIMILLISLALHGNRDTLLLPKQKIIGVITGLGFVALFAWMGIRVAKENSINESRHKGFICAMNELKQASGKLFIAAESSFPIDDFYAWDLPRNYPATNVLYKERLITHTYLKTLTRFGIHDLNQAIQTDNRILFIGNPSGLFNRMTASGPLPDFRCLNVWELKPTY